MILHVELFSQFDWLINICLDFDSFLVHAVRGTTTHPMRRYRRRVSRRNPPRPIFTTERKARH